MSEFLKKIMTISLLRNLPPSPERQPSLFDRAVRASRIRFRDPEQGGYVHDTASSLLITPGMAQYIGGTWTDTVGNVALTYMKRKTAGAATTQLIAPMPIPQNSAALKGSYLKSIDLWFEIATAGLTTLTSLISKATLPQAAAATGNAFAAPAAPAFTYDAFHTTNALRIAVGKHKMTLTITAPLWLATDDEYYVDNTVVDPGTTVFDYYGARANYTLRM